MFSVLLSVALSAPLPLTSGDPVTAGGAPPAFLNRDPTGFGVGLVAGIPSGLTFAWRQKESPVWFDASVAWGFDNDAFLLQGDILWNFNILHTADWSDVVFPVYVGIGPRLGVRPSNSSGYGSDNQAYLGARVPLGMGVMHAGVPLEGFLEIAPILALMPRPAFFFDIAIGGRIYFGK